MNPGKFDVLAYRKAASASSWAAPFPKGTANRVDQLALWTSPNATDIDRAQTPCGAATE